MLLNVGNLPTTARRRQAQFVGIQQFVLARNRHPRDQGGGEVGRMEQYTGGNRIGNEA